DEAVLLDRTLMNTSWQELLPKLNADADYARRFARVYGGPPDRASVLDAVAAFQRSLTTPNARFDRYLRGEQAAITAEEGRGFELFKSYGCSACHQGANVGGNLFQRFGIFADPFAEGGARGEPISAASRSRGAKATDACSVSRALGTLP